MIEINLVEEYRINEGLYKRIANLLQKTFTNVNLQKRTYYKQLPHSRFLAFEDKELAGHLGFDYRTMNMNGVVINVLGVYDLCVAENFKGRGISKQLMYEFESLALENKNNIDFLFLATDIPEFYKKFGFQKTMNTISWLKIDQHKNYGVGKELIKDTNFMIKPISGKKWIDGHLDMLGYMY